MDLTSLENLIHLAARDGPQKDHAIIQLHELRSHPQCLGIGLGLFLEGNTETSKVFGLSLVRDALSNSLAFQNIEERRYLRKTLFSYLSTCFGNNSVVPIYVINNFVTIFTLNIKCDYPENWSTAFEDLLAFSEQYGLFSADILVRIVTELEIEVVMFNEVRTKEEILHNTKIKDRMRETRAIKDLLEFLCKTFQASAAAGQGNDSARHQDLANRTLLCLSEMIGWIDIQLIITLAIPCIFNAIENYEVFRPSGLACIYELAKKGMDISSKLEIIRKLGIVNLLKFVSADFKSSVPLMKNDFDELKFAIHLKLAQTADLICLELLSTQLKFEETAFPTKQAVPNPSGTPEYVSRKSIQTNKNQDVGIDVIHAFIPASSELMHELMGILCNLMNHPCVEIALAIMPSVNKYVQLLKNQKLKLEDLSCSLAKYISENAGYFQTFSYFETLLTPVYEQCHFPADFDFADVDDDEELQELVESNRDVRRLFLSLCKINPNFGAQTILKSLTMCSSPFRSADPCRLECAFRLLHACSESGMDKTQNFPGILTAILETDVREHFNLEVKLAFFELCVKYLRYLNEDKIRDVALSILSNVSIRGQPTKLKYQQELRSRFASLALKVCEQLNDNAYIILPSTKDIIGEILVKNVEEFRSTMYRLPVQEKSRAKLLSESAENTLYEILSYLISVQSSSQQIKEVQEQLLHQVVEYVVNQVSRNAQEYAEVISGGNNYLKELIEHSSAQFLGCFSSLIKHLPKAELPYYLNRFVSIKSMIELIINSGLSFSSGVRSKLLSIFHHLVGSEKVEVLMFIYPYFHSLVVSTHSISDMDAVCQLLNQLISTFDEKALEFCRQLLPIVFGKFHELTVTIENAYQHAMATGQLTVEIEGDRIAILKQFLSFFQHLSMHHLEIILLDVITASHQSSVGGTFLDDVIQIIMLLLNEMSPLRCKLPRSNCIQLKRVCCIIINNLTSSWITAPPAVEAVNVGKIAMFKSFLFDQWLPIIFILMFPSLINSAGLEASELVNKVIVMFAIDFPAVVFNTKDAASQTILAEVGTLIYNLSRKAVMEHDGGTKLDQVSYCIDHEFIIYLTNLFVQLQWNEIHIKQFIDMLHNANGNCATGNAVVSVGTYKEQFKKLVRSFAL